MEVVLLPMPIDRRTAIRFACQEAAAAQLVWLSWDEEDGRRGEMWALWPAGGLLGDGWTDGEGGAS